MKAQNVWFYSDGFKLHGKFYYPDSGRPDDNKPILLVCSGFLGMNVIHPARFARALTRQGYICFGFDYRGFGESEGERGRVLLQEQINDIENAAIYVSLQQDSANRQIVLIGWGMGAGLVLQAADETPRLGGLICINGFYNGYRFLRERRSEKEWTVFMDWLQKQRAEEVLTGELKKVDPFTIYPLDDVTRTYVDDVLFKTDGFGGDVEVAFAYSLLHYNAESQLDTIPSVPLLVVHGEDNQLHPLSEATSLHEKYGGNKEIHIIKNVGHTEWMCDDCRPFETLIEKLLQWLKLEVHA